MTDAEVVPVDRGSLPEQWWRRADEDTYRATRPSILGRSPVAVYAGVYPARHVEVTPPLDQVDVQHLPWVIARLTEAHAFLATATDANADGDGETDGTDR